MPPDPTPPPLRFETRCVHTGVDQDAAFGSCITPIYQTSTFRWETLAGGPKGPDYTRSGNPTRTALEKNLAALEGGIDCRATATGMAAIAAVLHLFQPGDQIVSGTEVYGGTYRVFTKVFANLGLEFSFVDMRNLDAVRRAITPRTKCLWLETPSNPLLNLTDLAGAAKLAHDAGAITVCDNTFMSPYFQRPFEQGVDIVVHSTTKYLNGHSDVCGGAVITRHPEHAERIGFLVNAIGLACSPFDAWLVLRGVKTLGLRMEAHQCGAMAVARMLEQHPAVERVYYPGLPSHPHHELARRQMTGFGGMLSFDIKGGREKAERALNRTKLFAIAVSLGGVESLIEYPAMMSHASMPPDARRAAGIGDGTIRVSVGIEHPDDLISDLRQALES